MLGFDLLELVSKNNTKDDLGQLIPSETSRTVMARVESVSQSEFFQAGQIGLTPQYKVILSFAEDYAGEETAIYNGARYAIYRNYRTASGQMELYLRRETGVTKHV